MMRSSLRPLWITVPSPFSMRCGNERMKGSSAVKSGCSTSVEGWGREVCEVIDAMGIA